MGESEIEILLSSDSNYDKLIVEISYKGKFIALLNQDEGLDNIKIEFPGRELKEDAILRKISLSVFERALGLAKQKIKG